MNRNKENAYNHMMSIFCLSWTWERMTHEEQEAFRLTSIKVTLRGTFEQRCEQMHDIYRAFLAGLGYNGINWREQTA